MELFNFSVNPKLLNDKSKIDEFHENKYKLFVISSVNKNSDLKMLLNIKHLFKKMLPKMPKEYILRQVFDQNHFSIVLTESNPANIIGAICYRPAYDRNIVEIVFLAINASNHIRGYGTFMMNCLKEVVKMQYFNGISESRMNTVLFENLEEAFSIKTEDIFNTGDETPQANENIKKAKKRTALYLLTYADNSAIGFFKKQGFSTNPVSSQWVGFIKDYDGGTLMECKIHTAINYLNQRNVILSLGNNFISKLNKIKTFHILKDPSTCDGITTDLPERTPKEFLKDIIYFMICDLESNPSAWPFVEPVSPIDVPEYFEVIKHPMDLSTVLKKHHDDEYSDINYFIQDILLMISNCYTFNNRETQYYKCAENIERAFMLLLQKYQKTLCEWGFSIELELF